MALNWNTTEVKNYKKVIYRTLTEGEQGYQEGKETYGIRDIPKSIILYTMSVGLSEITEKNYEQFYNRIHLLEISNGTQYVTRATHKPIYTKLKDVKKMIGLTTNASTKTRSRFLNDNKINI